MQREIRLKIPAGDIDAFVCDFSDGELNLYVEWNDTASAEMPEDKKEDDEFLPEGPLDSLYDADESLDDEEQDIADYEEPTPIVDPNASIGLCGICGDPVTSRTGISQAHTVHNYCYYFNKTGEGFKIDDVVAVIDGPGRGSIASIIDYNKTASGPDSYRLSNDRVELGYVLAPPKNTPRPIKRSKKPFDPRGGGRFG